MNAPCMRAIERDRFAELIRSANSLRLAPGYLYLEGLFSWVESLQSVGETRLLISNLTHRDSLERIAMESHRLEPLTATAEERRYVSRPQSRPIIADTVLGFRRCLENMEQSEMNQHSGQRLLQLLSGNQVRVRVHINGSFGTRVAVAQKDRLVGLMGTSNIFLPQGLTPTECSVEINDSETLNGLIRWFDDLWDGAIDVTKELIDELRRSWIGDLVTPYDIYMKTLYALVGKRVEFDLNESLLDDVIDRLADFQRSAFRQAIQIIRDYGGVFIADVVGLGKSYIGAAIVKHFERTEQVRPLILCPASLVEMWEGYNESLALNARVLSIGMLRGPIDTGNPLLEPLYRDRDFVLIDESHAFRNPGSQRYDLVADFMAKGRRRVCLLTATPRNRSAWDIYHQLKLFHLEDRTTLPIDPPQLREYFRAIERGQRDLPSLLSHVLIRRTRNHVLRFYGYDAESGQRIDPSRFALYLQGTRRAYVMVGDRRQFFPRRELSTIEYSIEQTYQGLYQQIRTHLMSADPSLPNEPRLSFARYAIWDYVNTDQRGREPYLQLRRSSVALHGLVRTLLFKRFESSVVAFRVSVQRMAQSHRVFLLAIQEGIVPAGDEAQQVLRESDEDINETLDTLRSMSVRYPITDFDVARLTRDVQRDIELFERIIQLVEPITPDRDEKLLVLRSRLAQSPLAEGKRLIFTQFADTARYLFDQLSALDRPGARVAIMLSGDGNKSRIIGRFAPRSNPEYANHHPDEGISLLIATDVLSEGHNLQDCDKIINYDLHWNPVRLIQRFGRIDRIGSEFETIHGFNFLPEAGIERNLGLRQILRERIREIHDTIGEDSSILEAGEQLNTEAMYAIYEANGEPLAALEEELDSESVHLNEAEELLRHLRERDPDEYARIANLPDGIRSARRTNANGLFVFSRAGDYRRLLLVDREGRIISHDLPKILGLLKCAKDTPIAECPAYPTLPLLRTFHRFVQEWRERRTELNHMPHLTSAQRYVLRELNQLMSNPADSAMLSRIEQMDRAFRGSLPQALLRELNRIRRDGTEGEVMLRILIGLYFAHGLQHRESESNTRRDEEWPQIICSEAFLKSP